MMLLFGIAAVLLLWWLSKTFVRSDAKALARAFKVVGGIMALGAAVILGMRGRFDMALLTGGIGAWLLGWSASLPAPLRRFGIGEKRTSRMRSALIEVELDHATGAVRGLVLAGTFHGRRLEDLDPGSLSRLHGECQAADPEGLALLEAYLDRRFSSWRENAQANGYTRSGRQAQPGAMTKEEAYQVLGLQPGASVDDIQRAYRTLMKKLHPDQGGTTYLATRVNEAKEVLLSRHR
ncbi:DnaJ domain-containing protein [Microvirga pudoricolor]|uniref:DnaJ domain-containing protein n=1 Tax=Microvirga pudoricolor TaxID=2778729 RepID=UPI001E3BE6A7|nr:DnaJ domain-containing protein [Microvirga pudoricolor]